MLCGGCVAIFLVVLFWKHSFGHTNLSSISTSKICVWECGQWVTFWDHLNCLVFLLFICWCGDSSTYQYSLFDISILKWKKKQITIVHYMKYKTDIFCLCFQKKSKLINSVECAIASILILCCWCNSSGQWTVDC